MAQRPIWNYSAVAISYGMQKKHLCATGPFGTFRPANGPKKMCSANIPRKPFWGWLLSPWHGLLTNIPHMEMMQRILFKHWYYFITIHILTMGNTISFDKGWRGNVYSDLDLKCLVSNRKEIREWDSSTIVNYQHLETFCTLSLQNAYPHWMVRWYN